LVVWEGAFEGVPEARRQVKEGPWLRNERPNAAVHWPAATFFTAPRLPHHFRYRTSRGQP